MSIESLTVLAVVPARGGSKGVPRKNLRHVAGKSLLSWVADVAAETPEIDHVVLSTDDEEIAREGKQAGLDVPFMRPDKLAADQSKSIDAWRHAWVESEKIYKQQFDVSVLLEPTSPLRKSIDISNVIKKLIDSEADSVVTVSKTPAHFTPEKTLKIDSDGVIVPYLEGGLQYTLRQGIPDYYHRNGVCYCVTRKQLVDNNKIMEGNCIPYVIDRPLVNIDDELDFAWAEFLLSRG